MSYGMNFNMALTSGDGKSTCGIHLTDSTGLDISREATGASLTDVLTKAFQTAASDLHVVTDARQLQAEKKAAEERRKNEEKLNIKRKKIAALKKQAEELQAEIDSMQKAAQDVEEKSDNDIAGNIVVLDEKLKNLFDIFF